MKPLKSFALPGTIRRLLYATEFNAADERDATMERSLAATEPDEQPSGSSGCSQSKNFHVWSWIFSGVSAAVHGEPS